MFGTFSEKKFDKIFSVFDKSGKGLINKKDMVKFIKNKRVLGGSHSEQSANMIGDKVLKEI